MLAQHTYSCIVIVLHGVLAKKRDRNLIFPSGADEIFSFSLALLPSSIVSAFNL